MKLSILFMLLFGVASTLYAESPEETHNGKVEIANKINCGFIQDEKEYNDALVGWTKQNAPAMVDMGFSQGLQFRGLKPGLDGYIELLKYTMKKYGDPANINRGNDYYLGSEKINYGPWKKNMKVYVQLDPKGNVTKILMQTDVKVMKEYYIDEYKMMFFQEYTK